MNRITDRAIAIAVLATLGIITGVIGSDIFGCTQQQAQSADAVAIDLTNAVCSAVEGTLQNPVVDIVCTVAQGVEQGIGVLESSDAGTSTFATAPPTIRTVYLHMPAADAQAFLQAHKGAAK